MRISIRLQPRAGADRLAGIAEARGGPVLKAMVAAPAEAGRANAALIELVARACGVPRREVAIIGGLKSRNKLVEVSGEPEALGSRLQAALAATRRQR